MTFDYNIFTQWLIKNEWQHVDFSSRLKSFEGNKIINWKFKEEDWGYYIKTDSGYLLFTKNNSKNPGGLYLTNNGMLFPAFSNKTLENKEFPVLRLMLSPFQDSIKAVIGLDWRVRIIEKTIKNLPQQSVSYRILTHELKDSIKIGKNISLIIRRASFKDLNELWPLELAYLKEEVLSGNSRINERFARKLLGDTLIKQLVFCAISGENTVAKANTNARGWIYDQLGGIFVVPNYRNHGIGRSIMHQLLFAIYQEQRKCCLFVKDSNLPALHLYNSLGFQDRGKFRISYWGD